MHERATVLVIDGGGRGAALVDKYAQSEHVDRIIAIPGNDLAGSNTDKEVTSISSRNGKPITTTDIPEILEICHNERVELVDVAQDDAVAVGVTNAVRRTRIPVVGPTRNAGQIEWDKAWARQMGDRWNLRQPEYLEVTTIEEGEWLIYTHPDKPRVIKASGLALGKGVRFAQNWREAKAEIGNLREAFPEAASTYLLEEMLVGEEFSSFALCDGSHHIIIGHAQDHKKVFDNDQGDNTGGMGCSTPPILITSELEAKIKNEVFSPVVEGLNKKRRPYKGVLYLGGMVTNSGEVYVIEFNARWGDPEAQVILPGLIGDLFEISMAVSNGDISNTHIQMDNKSRVVIAGVSKGYPGNYDTVKGRKVHGLDDARKIRGVRVYGAGIKVVDGVHVANGGRLFYIVGEGKDVIEARARAYDAMELVSIDGDNLHYRTDIGWRDVERIEKTKLASQGDAFQG